VQSKTCLPFNSIKQVSRISDETHDSFRGVVLKQTSTGRNYDLWWRLTVDSGCPGVVTLVAAGPNATVKETYLLTSLAKCSQSELLQITSDLARRLTGLNKS
jgi:secreted trypsin-like serine protease